MIGSIRARTKENTRSSITELTDKMATLEKKLY